MVYSNNTTPPLDTGSGPSETKPSGAHPKKIRVPDILALKGKRPIAAITCYDATFARLIQMTPIDLVLVGDSLGHVIQGHNSTLTVTVEHVAYHTRCVAQVLKTPLLVADMPFCSAGFSDAETFKNAELLMRAGAEAVKIEGATPEICSQISRLVRHGIPVMGHVGLTPQSVHGMGGYKIQGKEESGKQRLLQEVELLEKSGCFSIVFELISPATSTELTRSLSIPSVGIGAGANCDGQILVLQDMLGMNLDFAPKFLKHFAKLQEEVTSAVSSYCNEVVTKSFPVP